MKKHVILSPQPRAMLFDAPPDPISIARSDYRPTAKVAFHEATGTDRGDAIVAGIIAFLRQQGILLPTATMLERIALTA